MYFGVIWCEDVKRYDVLLWCKFCCNYFFLLYCWICSDLLCPGDWNKPVTLLEVTYKLKCEGLAAFWFGVQALDSFIIWSFSFRTFTHGSNTRKKHWRSNHTICNPSYEDKHSSHDSRFEQTMKACLPERTHTHKHTLTLRALCVVGFNGAE